MTAAQWTQALSEARQALAARDRRNLLAAAKVPTYLGLVR